MEQMLEDGAEAVAKKVIELAKGGDIQAARIIFDRCYPAPKGRFIEIEMPEMKTTADLVAAHGAIMSAIADGEITIDGARRWPASWSCAGRQSRLQSLSKASQRWKRRRERDDEGHREATARA